MAENLKVTMRTREAVGIVDLKGEVTSFADEAINSLIHASVSEGIRKFVLNFTDVSYINSSGIAILIGIVTSPTHKDLTFRVYGLTPHFKKIFRMIGLTQYVNVLGTEEEALATL